MEFFWILVVVGFGITAALLAYDAGYREGVSAGLDMALRRREPLPPPPEDLPEWFHDVPEAQGERVD